MLLASDAVSCSFDSALVSAFGGAAGAAAIGPFLIVRVACLIVACVTPRSIWETLANRFVLTDLSNTPGCRNGLFRAPAFGALPFFAILEKG